MRQLIERGERIGRARQRKALERVTEAATRIEGVRVGVAGETVTLSGRGLIRRWLQLAELRFLAGLAR